MRPDRIKRMYYNVVRSLIGTQLDYGLLYRARVVGQPAPNEIDVLVDHERFRGAGWSHIPIKHGLPGFKAKVSKGARCLVGFENADPSKPYAMMWEPTSAEVTFNDGTKPVARVDDSVNCGYLLIQTSPSPGTQYFAHDQELLAEAARVAIQGAGGVATVQPMTGIITSGNVQLKA